MRNWTLCASSCGFAIAGAIGLFIEEYLLGLTAILTSMMSINFWRWEVDGLRHTMDVAMANISFMIFTIHGIQNPHIFVYGWPCWFGIVVCFIVSRRLQKRPKFDRTWQIPHVLFHLLVAMGQLLVIMGRRMPFTFYFYDEVVLLTLSQEMRVPLG